MSGASGEAAPNAFKDRKGVVDEFESARMSHEPGKRHAHETLKRLRNALAHGTQPKNQYKAMLRDADRLFRELRDATTELLG